MSGSSVGTTYPWYTQVDSTDPVQQGDFVLKCQIIQPSVEAQQTDQNIRVGDVYYHWDHDEGGI